MFHKRSTSYTQNPLSLLSSSNVGEEENYNSASQKLESAKVFAGGQRAGFHQLMTLQCALFPLIY